MNELFKSQALGVTVAGRVESGLLMKGDSLLILPSNEQIIVKGIEMNGEPINLARAGDNIEIGLKDLSDASAISIGSWLCDPQHPIPITNKIRASILTTNLARPILQGETCILYTQSAQEPVVITALLATLDKTTGAVVKTRPRALGRSKSADVENHFGPLASDGIVQGFPRARPIRLAKRQGNNRCWNCDRNPVGRLIRCH